MNNKENANSLPNPAFEQILRAQITEILLESENFEEFIRINPIARQILDLEGGLKPYLFEMLPTPESWTYLTNIYLYYLIWYFENSDIGINAILRIIKNIDDILKDGISIDFKPLIDEIDKLNKTTEKGFKDVNSIIGGFPFGIRAILTTGFASQVTAIEAAASAVVVAIETLQPQLTETNVNLLEIDRTLNSRLEAINTSIQALPQEIAEKLEDFEQSIIQKTAKEVNRTIVGESYFKWSSTSQFYPSMVFVFAEPNSIQYPRKSQIKVRLQIKAEDFTEDLVAEFQDRLNNADALTYQYGNFRCNYVSQDKRFKTTLYTASRNEAVRILGIIHFIIQDEFLESNLSVTEGWRRPPLGRRNDSLGTNPAELQDYNEIFEVTLTRATIFVGGLKYPVEIY